MISAKVEGLSELSRRMKELEPKLRKSALRSAVSAGAQVIKKEAQTLAPVGTARLQKKAIYVTRSKRDSSNGVETFKVAVHQWRKGGNIDAYGEKDAFYWRFLEFGTKFISARPFLRPAFESKKMEALEAMKQKLFQKLEQLTAGNK